jgi:hypothetical protein
MTGRLYAKSSYCCSRGYRPAGAFRDTLLRATRRLLALQGSLAGFPLLTPYRSFARISGYSSEPGFSP